MPEDWKELDVLSSLHSINPPESMWAHGDHKDKLEARSAKIREHYNEILEELRDGGYERVVTMKNRLESHLSEVKDRLAKWRGRVLSSRLQYRAYRQRLLDLADEKTSDDADSEEVDEKFVSLLDTPIGAPWYADGIVKGDLQSDWDVSLVHYANSSPNLSDVSVGYRPTEEALSKFGLHRRYDYDSDSFHSALTRRFSGDTTWREAFESLEKQRDANIERKNQATRTSKLLRFRLSVIETVLYRFETFGSVEEMTEAEADEVAQGASQEDSISGYHGAEYALEANKILKEDGSITSFSKLARKMETGFTSGSSRVDTVKRNIGYDDLPREEKGFPRFRNMLTEKVKQLKGEDEG